MQGEELNAADITAGGLLGDRQFAVIDRATGKVAGAKNPRKWPGFLYFRAAYTEPPRADSALPAVRVTTPGGASATTDEADLPKLLSEALAREVTMSAALPAATAEEYVTSDDEVASFDLPAGTFFDAAVVHLLTTATLDRLRSLYPMGRFEPRRFRPNIIVATGSDTSGFIENDWVGHEIAIGEQCPPSRDDGDWPLCHDHASAGRPAEGFRDPAHRRPAQQRRRSASTPRSSPAGRSGAEIP